MKKTWIQINGKLIPKDQYYGDNTRNQAPGFLPDIEPFVSPIDGSVITSRPKLQAHMKRHGVTHSADYSPEYLERRTNERITEQKRADRADRIRLIKRQLEN